MESEESRIVYIRVKLKINLIIILWKEKIYLCEEKSIKNIKIIFSFEEKQKEYYYKIYLFVI